MSTPVSPAVVTISDTKSVHPGALPFFLVLTETLTMPLSIKQDEPQTVFSCDKLVLSHANCVRDFSNVNVEILLCHGPHF